jgi:transposase InsO family protein
MSIDITGSRVTSSGLVVCVNALGYLSGHWTRKHSGRSTVRVAAPLADPVRAGLQPVQCRLGRPGSPDGGRRPLSGRWVPVRGRCARRGGAVLPSSWPNRRTLSPTSTPPWPSTVSTASTSAREPTRNYPLAENAIFHSYRGSNYTSCQFAATLKKHGLRQSAGRTGVCYNNATAELFFAALKNERVHRTRYPTRDSCVLRHC